MSTSKPLQKVQHYSRNPQSHHAVSHGQMHDLAATSPRLNQLKALSFAMQNSPRALQFQTTQSMLAPASHQGTAAQKQALQGKFVGPLAPNLLNLNTQIIDPANTSYFSRYRAELEASPKNITVANQGSTSFDYKTGIFSINPSVLKEIADYTDQKQAGNILAGDEIDSAGIISHVATIAHELSHARDVVIEGLDIPAGDKAMNVVTTELDAWAVEAITAAQIAKNLNVVNDVSKANLLTGWLAFTEDDLTNLWTSRQNNEVAGRLFRYIKREIDFESKETMNVWIKTHEVAIMAKINENKQRITTDLKLKKTKPVGPIVQVGIAALIAVLGWYFWPG